MSAAVLAFAAALAFAPQEASAAQDPAQLEEVVVQGSLRERIRDFVNEVSAPPRRRGLARWRTRMCVGVVNLQPAHAQAMIDRVVDVAAEYEVRTGTPGCTPNVVIVFTEDGAAMADAMVEAEGGQFRYAGLRSIDRGKRALDEFRTMEAPVRWWHVSLPVVGGSTMPGIRLPGGGAPMVPGEGLVNRGRPIADILTRVFIVVDVDEVQQATFAQLSDYIAFVALAQVDPEAETAAYDTILNLFQDPAAPQALTDWDMAYLTALYSTHSRRINPGAQANDVARLLERDQRQPAPATPPPAQPPSAETD